MPVSSLHPPPHPLLPNAYSPILPLERLSYPTNSEPDIEPDSVRRVYRLRIAFEGTPHFQAKSSYIGLPVAPRSRCDDLVSVVTLKLLRMNARENERKSLGVRWRRTGSSFFARFAKITPPSVFRGPCNRACKELWGNFEESRENEISGLVRVLSTLTCKKEKEKTDTKKN
ncbi:hypothetical protein L218DRAFT_666120 [Marasmius fiardii PR-910]|nr:hypothetical protein L218DRAFT_666120 [Marasmius fiardii PR-910]